MNYAAIAPSLRRTTCTCKESCSVVSTTYQPCVSIAVERQRSEHSFNVSDASVQLEPRMAVKVQTVAVLCNRFLIETGLLSRHPNLSLTQAYEKFRRKLVSPKKKLTPSGISLLTSISQQTGMKVRLQPVATELDNLIHELSKDAHLVDCEACHLALLFERQSMCACAKVIHYPRLQTRGYFLWRAIAAGRRCCDGSVPIAGVGKFNNFVVSLSHWLVCLLCAPRQRAMSAWQSLSLTETTTQWRC